MNPEGWQLNYTWILTWALTRLPGPRIVFHRWHRGHPYDRTPCGQVTETTTGAFRHERMALVSMAVSLRIARPCLKCYPGGAVALSMFREVR